MAFMVGDAGLLDVNGTLIAEVIAFIIMVLIFAKWVYPPIIRVAENRNLKIEQGVRAADEAEKRLAEVKQEVGRTLDEAKAQARDILARSHSDASVEAQEVLKQARAEAEAQIERARVDIGAERDRAIQELRGEVSALVVQATAQLVGETLDAKKHQKLIDEALNRVGDAGPSASSRN